MLWSGAVWEISAIKPSYLFFCSAFHVCVTLSAFLVSEEPSEDVEGPSETAGDAEEPAKEQESGGDKDQGKWTDLAFVEHLMAGMFWGPESWEEWDEGHDGATQPWHLSQGDLQRVWRLP
ncbi:hypothetical protein Nmel_012019 [Mimus melanotis]